VEVLSDECLSEFFHLYGASAGLFAMIGALFTHISQYLATSVFKKSSQEKDTEEASSSHAHNLDHSENNPVTVYILEAGIAIHSIIIGVDLGLTIEEFRVLLLALVFHQFFEGIGLGYKLAELKTKKIIRPVINSMIYAFTTPLGVVIGILSHVYSAPTDYVHSTEAKGVIDAMAGGILIYVSLVNMVYEEFKAESFQKLSTTEKIINYFSFYLGAGIMALIGLWA
jgi:zinc transporter 1/2/3